MSPRAHCAPGSGVTVSSFHGAVEALLEENAVLYGSDREPIKMGIRLFPDWAEMWVQNSGKRLSLTSL